MDQITKIAAVENATAIWEYDPTQNDNRVLGGSLDVIAAICTLAIKVSMSPQTVLNVLTSIAVDSGVWTTHRILREYPASLRAS